MDHVDIMYNSHGQTSHVDILTDFMYVRCPFKWTLPILNMCTLIRVAPQRSLSTSIINIHCPNVFGLIRFVDVYCLSGAGLQFATNGGEPGTAGIEAGDESTTSKM